jgi:hypothetical protein
MNDDCANRDRHRPLDPQRALLSEVGDICQDQRCAVHVGVPLGLRGNERLHVRLLPFGSQLLNRLETLTSKPAAVSSSMATRLNSSVTPSEVGRAF